VSHAKHMSMKELPTTNVAQGHEPCKDAKFTDPDGA